MKLIRYGNRSSEKLAVLEGDTRVDFSEFVGDYDETFFANVGLAELARWLGPNRRSAKTSPRTIAPRQSDCETKQDCVRWPELSRPRRGKQDAVTRGT
jgi:hypothetical protein